MHKNALAVGPYWEQHSPGSLVEFVGLLCSREGEREKRWEGREKGRKLEGEVWEEILSDGQK